MALAPFFEQLALELGDPAGEASDYSAAAMRLRRAAYMTHEKPQNSLTGW